MSGALGAEVEGLDPGAPLDDTVNLGGVARLPVRARHVGAVRVPVAAVAPRVGDDVGRPQRATRWRCTTTAASGG
ncbi:MAG: hypothetical protein QM733_03470 [Ilumatobacteraceae bacterium]